MFILQLYTLLPSNNTTIPKYTVTIEICATDNLYHIMLYRVSLARAGFKLTMLVVIGSVNPTTIQKQSRQPHWGSKFQHATMRKIFKILRTSMEMHMVHIIYE
jgi:hypothetical protein